MPSSNNSNNEDQPSAAPVRLAPDAGDLSSPSSTATTLSSESSLRASSFDGPQRVDRPFNVLQTHDEDSVTATNAATTQGELVDTTHRKVLGLKRDMNVASKDARYATNGLFKAAYSTDLLFLMDTTNSMRPYINAAKNQVKTIINDIKATFFGEADVRVAVVSYKDHNAKTNVEYLDFTSSVDEVHAFLDRLRTAYGADFPEDVLGGLNQAINTSWKHQTRCIIHIGDAPPHGVKYHDLGEKCDNYPQVGSEPHKLTLEPLLDKMVELNINYALLRITEHMDRMAKIVFENYAAASAGCKLHPKNRFAEKMPDQRGLPRDDSPDSGLFFEEQELGTQFEALQHLVLKSVTESASRSAMRMVSSATRSSHLKTTTNLDSTLTLAAITEEKTRDSLLETAKPRWNTKGWLDETLTVEGFSPNLSVKSSSTLDEMLDNEDNIEINAVELLIHKRSRPFAQGATRLASYARAQTMSDRFVVKSFKKEGKPFTQFAKDMQCQALCKAFALEFNSLLGETTVFDFIVTTCLKGRKSLGSENEEFLSLEPFIEGTYVKYNNNHGYVNKDLREDPMNQAAQAFSHFTYERSHGRFLICDLQGVGGLLTDPAIHSLDPGRFNLTDTNLGPDGFKFFFALHNCNDVCRQLGLKSNTAMMRRGIYEFRRDWPSPASRFRCCSNKLCGKITRLPANYNADQPVRYHWCHSCFQQMRSSNERIVCEAIPKPKHDFIVSRFLCESQGLALPRACRDHRGMELPEISEKGKRRDSDKWSLAGSEGRKSVVVSPSEGGGFWSRLTGGSKRSSK